MVALLWLQPIRKASQEAEELEEASRRLRFQSQNHQWRSPPKLRIRAKAHGDGSRLEVEKLGQASEGCHKEENQIV
eukprot:CAMPEP_0113850440 /NCGR_PEP_ID=MMETSP0372-20130328/3886_1 /TAXON_ID=340204 /ORGANISM="Lankesteria abbotti" /LENGTH=75 /DNA_ID=CAMNT_0000820739 /DNA_START=147 /DNA_END=374 /DNA_ORIENTATION=+ /assembly_acc=CAM_ASM_000359